MEPEVIFRYFFLLFSLVLMGAGLHSLYSDSKRSKLGFHTMGKVIKVKGEWSLTGNSFQYMYFPIVEFTSQDGNVLQLKYPVGASFAMHREGQTLNCIYFDGELHPTGSNWRAFYWFLTGLGLVVGLYVTYLLITGEASFFANL
jgi:hypothetical protein